MRRPVRVSELGAAAETAYSSRWDGPCMLYSSLGNKAFLWIALPRASWNIQFEFDYWNYPYYVIELELLNVKWIICVLKITLLFPVTLNKHLVWSVMFMLYL